MQVYRDVRLYKYISSLGVFMQSQKDFYEGSSVVLSDSNWTTGIFYFFN